MSISSLFSGLGKLRECLSGGLDIVPDLSLNKHFNLVNLLLCEWDVVKLIIFIETSNL